MRLSPEARELLKLKNIRRMDEIMGENRNEIYRLQQLATRSGGAQAALDNLYVDMISKIVDVKVEEFMTAFRREDLIPTKEEIEEITRDLSETARGIWFNPGHQPAASSQDAYQSIVPRARLSLVVAIKEMERDARQRPAPASGAAQGELVVDDRRSYVDPKRVEELRQTTSTSFDLTRLLALCDELNVCFPSGANHATAMLLRAILDHVPPIFGCTSFQQVANNYPGSKSFKECMQSLDSGARKIGDGHLHTQIRPREVLPTATQVNFSAQLDVLLGEIIRILK